jgi:uncharacterized protein (TIGR03067 family)
MMLKTPKWLDFQTGSGEKTHGIYDVNESILTICWCEEVGGDRPTKFATTPGSPLVLWVLKRALDVQVEKQRGQEPKKPYLSGSQFLPEPKKPELSGSQFLLEPKKPETAKPLPDQKAIQGRWKVVTCEIDGDKVATEDFSVVITGDKILVKDEGLIKEFTYTLDPTQKPKHIDWVPTFGVKKGSVIPGIYRLDGNKLVFCTKSGPEDANRPAAFKTEAESQLSLMVLQREKPIVEKTVPGERDDAELVRRAILDASVKKELKALEGKWKVVAVAAGGMELPIDKLPGITFVLRSDGTATAQLLEGDEGEMKLSVVLDLTKKPKRMVITHESGSEEGKKQYAIYEVVGDKLTIFATRPGAPEEDRPADFSAKDAKARLMVFERVKVDKKR